MRGNGIPAEGRRGATLMVGSWGISHRVHGESELLILILEEDSDQIPLWRNSRGKSSLKETVFLILFNNTLDKDCSNRINDVRRL